MRVFVCMDTNGLLRREIAAKTNAEWQARDAIYDSSASVLSDLARRNNRWTRASACLCEGVRFCFREGNVISAHHVSADHVSCAEGPFFDVGGEASCSIGRRSSRIIGLEGP